jgi:hypothetical protein
MKKSAPRWSPRATAFVASIALLVGCKSNDGADAITISEFLASNANGIKDSDGETTDWIEIFNSSSVTVDLTDWRLTDDVDEPAKWLFPPTSIGGGQYLIVFASSKLAAPGETELHTGFRLKATPDFLALLRPNGRAVQKFAPYPEQTNDISYGLGSDGVAGYLQTPTPGAPNSPSLDKKKHKNPDKEKSDKPKAEKAGDDD